MIKMTIKSLLGDLVQQTICVSDATDIYTIDSLFKNWPCRLCGSMVLQHCLVKSYSSNIFDT